MKDRGIRGVLFAEPFGVSKVSSLSRQRGESFTEVLKDQVSKFGPFFRSVQYVLMPEVAFPRLDRGQGNRVFLSYLRHALPGQ